jgi:hypothetical protein
MSFEELAELCAKRLFPDDPWWQAHYKAGIMEIYRKRHENDPPAKPAPSIQPLADEEMFA